MKKKLFIPVVCLLLLTAAPVTVPADIRCMAGIQAKIPAVQPYSSDTEYRYKCINGIWHKRLWSNSENRWIDPKWTPV